MVHRKSRSGGTVEASEATLRELLKDVPSDVRRRLSQEVGVLIEEHVQGERERCVAMCRRRAELWRKTSTARSGVAPAREEARARANEARYLADLIESGADVSGVGGPGGADAGRAGDVGRFKDRGILSRVGILRPRYSGSSE